jgi:hypothetical protein
MKITKYIAFLLLLFASCNLIAQDSIVMVYQRTIACSKNFVWDVDNLGNLFLTEKDQISKFNSEGEKMFSQSLKKYGKISSVDVRNPMKIILFSEQQQTLIFLDNTLTRQDNDIDLSTYDLNYVTQISGSQQADKIWAFDQENSKIKLITSKKQQSISIENIAGILGIRSLLQFYETDNVLYLLDEEKGIFLLDMYGTLINSIALNNAFWVQSNGNFLYILKEDEKMNSSLELLDLDSKFSVNLSLPSGTNKFKVEGNKLYLERENEIQIYLLETF